MQHFVQRVIERREALRIGAAAQHDARHAHRSRDVRHAGVVGDQETRMPQQRRQHAEWRASGEIDDGGGGQLARDAARQQRFR